MRISVIIPTLNAASYIEKLISSLQNQSKPPFEIIVVDSSSDDQTVQIAKAMKAAILTVSREAFDHGGTRNLAAAHATGDILVFVTQDALPSNELFIENLIEPLKDDEVAAAYGRQVSIPGTQLLERISKEFNYPPVSCHKSKEDLGRYGIKTFFFTNVCSAAKTSVFYKVGKFPEPIIVSEDMMLAAKCILADYKVVYVADAQVNHSHNYTLQQTFKRYFDIGGALGMNRWILDYTSAEGQGGQLLKTQIRQLIRPVNWRWIPLWMGESVVKYAGYRLGLLYHTLPKKMRRGMSMHPKFWDRRENTNSIMR